MKVKIMQKGHRASDSQLLGRLPKQTVKLRDRAKPVVAQVFKATRHFSLLDYYDLGWVIAGGQKRMVSRSVALSASTYRGLTDGPWEERADVEPFAIAPRRPRAPAAEAAWWERLILGFVRAQPPGRGPYGNTVVHWHTPAGIASDLAYSFDAGGQWRLEELAGAPIPEGEPWKLLEQAGWGNRKARAALSMVVRGALDRLTRKRVLVMAYGLGLRGREAKTWALREWAGD